MGMKLTLIATAAILSAAAAGAQSATQDPQPASGAAPQADTKVQADTSAKADSANASAKAEIKAGATVYDSSGNAVGKIDSIDGKSAVLNTGKVKVKVPVSSIARDQKGLAISMSKADIEAAASKK